MVKVNVSYKLLEPEKRINVTFYNNQEGTLLAYATDDDTYAIKLPNGSVAFSVREKDMQRRC